MEGEAPSPAARLWDYHKRGRDLLLAQTRAIDFLIDELHRLHGGQANEAVRIPILMLQAVGVSVHSVLALTREREMSIRDCFGIARSAIETAINASFITVSGEPMAQKAIRHMRQKRWRDLRRQGRLGQHHITVSRDVGVNADDVPGLREALAEYTNKRGDEIRDWTPENIDKRITAISEQNRRAGLCLAVASFSVYRAASELLHGTYYGVVLFWQGSRDTPIRGRAEFDDLWVTEHFVNLVTALFFAISGAIDAIAGAHKLAPHAKHQDDLAQALSELVEEMRGQNAEHDHRFSAEVRRG